MTALKQALAAEQEAGLAGHDAAPGVAGGFPPNKANFGPAAGPDRPDDLPQILGGMPVSELAVETAAAGEFAKVAARVAEVARAFAPSGADARGADCQGLSPAHAVSAPPPAHGW
jgi:hypothetical protein